MFEFPWAAQDMQPFPGRTRRRSRGRPNTVANGRIRPFKMLSASSTSLTGPPPATTSSTAWSRPAQRFSPWRGGVIALWIDHDPDYLINLFAVWAAGATPFLLSRRLPAATVLTLAEHGKARALVASAPVGPCPIPVLAPACDHGGPEDAPAAEIGCPTQEIALILHTSGTTNLPKLVPFTLANLRASLALQLRRWGRAWSDRDASLGALPLFHAFGLTCELLCCYRLRSRYYFCNPNPNDMLARLRREGGRITHLFTVPWMLQQLLDAPSGLAALKQLRFVIVGGAAGPGHRRPSRRRGRSRGAELRYERDRLRLHGTGGRRRLAGPFPGDPGAVLARRGVYGQTLHSRRLPDAVPGPPEGFLHRRHARALPLRRVPAPGAPRRHPRPRQRRKEQRAGDRANAPVRAAPAGRAGRIPGEWPSAAGLHSATEARAGGGRPSGHRRRAGSDQRRIAPTLPPGAGHGAAPGPGGQAPARDAQGDGDAEEGGAGVPGRAGAALFRWRRRGRIDARVLLRPAGGHRPARSPFSTRAWIRCRPSPWAITSPAWPRTAACRPTSSTSTRPWNSWSSTCAGRSLPRSASRRCSRSSCRRISPPHAFHMTTPATYC